MMKKYIYNFIICLSSLLFLNACQSEDGVPVMETGFLRLEVGANVASNTKATEDEVPYNAKVLQVSILKANGEKACDPFEYDATSSTAEKKIIELPTGTYSIHAASVGFDGKTSAYDKPYYVGTLENIVVSKDTETPARVVCTLANVKVTVKFDQSFKDAFTSAIATISSLETGAADQLIFKMGETQSVGYFPVMDLVSSIAVVNKEGEQHNQKNEVTGVKARDHYIFNYKVAESGTGSINISVDEATRTYTYDFTVPKKAELEVSANAWSNFAYLEATVPTSGSAIDVSKIEFQYKLPSENDDAWKKIEGEITPVEEGIYRIIFKGLSPETSYQCRVSYDNGASISSTIEFTPENQIALYNGNFDLWTQSGNTWYPGSSEEAGNTTSFWNTSNPGTSQGIGAIGGAINPTTGVTSPVYTPGGQAAKLESTEKIGVFAAASLYTGSFLGLDGMSANMEFGKPFTARPIALHGYYKYVPQVINKLDRKPDGVEIVQGETMDQCAIFIALATRSFTFNNKNEDEYIDYANDTGIIAYGELPSGEATSGDDYVEFTIPLKYRNLTDKPTHIIIVCSASKYGDYMTGGKGSTLYLDDFELIYDGEPTIWK